MNQVVRTPYSIPQPWYTILLALIALFSAVSALQTCNQPTRGYIEKMNLDIQRVSEENRRYNEQSLELAEENRKYNIESRSMIEKNTAAVQQLQETLGKR